MPLSQLRDDLPTDKLLHCAPQGQDFEMVDAARVDRNLYALRIISYHFASFRSLFHGFVAVLRLRSPLNNIW